MAGWAKCKELFELSSQIGKVKVTLEHFGIFLKKRQFRFFRRFLRGFWNGV